MKRIATYRDFLGELKVTYKRTKTPTVKINSSLDAAEFIRPYFDETMDYREEFKIIHLNNSNFVVNVHHVASGGDVGVLIDIKMAVRHALHINTKAVVCVHNHPSGGTKFSQGDHKTHRRLKKAFEYFDITLLDSLVVTRETYISMADDGFL